MFVSKVLEVDKIISNWVKGGYLFNELIRLLLCCHLSADLLPHSDLLHLRSQRFRVIFPRFIIQGGMTLPLRAVGPLLLAFFLLYSFINISILFCNGLFVFGRICGLKRVPPLILLLPLARLWPDLFLLLYTAILDLYHMECVMECTEFVQWCVCERPI